MAYSEENTLLYYWLILYRYRKSVVLVTLFSVSIAVVISLNLKPVYESYAMFFVPEKSLSMSYLSENSVDKLARDAKVPFPKEEPQAPYLGLLKSKSITTAVQKEFPHKSLLRYFLSDVDFELTDEFMMKVYSRDSDPVKAADIANAYVRHLNELLQASSDNDSDISLIEQQAEEAQQRLISAQEELQKFEKKNTITSSLDEEIKTQLEQKIYFQSQLETNRVRFEENDKSLQAISEQLKKEKDIYAEGSFILTNPLVEHLQQQLSDFAIQITHATLELREKHPDVISLKRRYAETEDRLNKELQRLMTSKIMPDNTFAEQLRQKLGNAIIEKCRLTAENKAYTETIHRITERMGKIPALNMEWKRLNDKIDSLKKMSEQLKINSREASMQRSRKMQFVVSVDTALPPDRPSFPILWLNVFVALLFGVGAGILYAFFLNYIEVTRKCRMLKLIQTINEGE